MAKYSFDYEFFFPNTGEGNKTLGSTQSRVTQALKCLTSPGDYIELPDGKTCASPEELECVLDEYSRSKPTREFPHTKKTKLKIVDYPLTIVAVILLVLGSIYLFAKGIFAIRVICTILGLATSIYVVKRMTVSHVWQKAFNLCIICFSLTLVVNVIDIFNSFGSDVIRFIDGIVCISANIVAIIAFAKMSKLVKNGWFSIVFTLISFICFIYCLYWTLDLLGFDVTGFIHVYRALLGIRYVLLAVAIGFIGCGLIDISSTERQKHVKHTLISLLVATVVCAWAGIDDYQLYQSILEYEESRPHYKGIHAALENGDIRYGMSYTEISNICGPADNTTKRNGVVEFAYYGNVQLCFEKGRFDHWNEY